MLIGMMLRMLKILAIKKNNNNKKKEKNTYFNKKLKSISDTPRRLRTDQTINKSTWNNPINACTNTNIF